MVRDPKATQDSSATWQSLVAKADVGQVLRAKSFLGTWLIEDVIRLPGRQGSEPCLERSTFQLTHSLGFGKRLNPVHSNDKQDRAVIWSPKTEVL